MRIDIGKFDIDPSLTVSIDLLLSVYAIDSNPPYPVYYEIVLSVCAPWFTFCYKKFIEFLFRA